MINFLDASMSELSVHRVGNKSLDEFYVLSKQAIAIENEELSRLLIHYFLSPFEKTNAVYRLAHPDGYPEQNKMFEWCTAIFDAPSSIHEQSLQMAKTLFDISGDPKIKSGELYVVYFKGIQLEGEQTEAVGVFKSESKESYLKIYPEGEGFAFGYEPEGINISKLDRGCLIFNTEREKGYKVLVVNQGSRVIDTSFWIDDFLNLQIRNDNYNQTQNVLGIYKSFVTEKLDEEFEVSKTDKIDLLNRSMKYFKEKDNFDLDEFSNEVIANDQGIALFKAYKKDYESEFDATIADQFDISEAAVKKQAKLFKSILKLDKNFHIYIHGNKELIEKGFDDGRSMNYYKVYFKDEQ